MLRPLQTPNKKKKTDFLIILHRPYQTLAKPDVVHISSDYLYTCTLSNNYINYTTHKKEKRGTRDPHLEDHERGFLELIG